MKQYNKQILVLCALLLAIAILCSFSTNKTCQIPVLTDPTSQVSYVGSIESTSGLKVRLLVLKHCFESMADGDARLAIEAANLAKTKGLNISDIGNFYINRQGQAQRLVFDQKLYADGLKDFISQQMKVNAQPGDTLVIFTIGHGANQGYLQSLGQREGIFKIMAEAAEENKQETIWWQLSCYASAQLPSINTLNDSQQNLFSVIASSDAHTESPAYVEGKIMEKVFVALGSKDPNIDPDHNEIVTAGEIANFLNSVKQGRGKLVYAKSPQESLFGIGLARLIPIIDKNNPNQKYPDDYIQYPNQAVPIPRTLLK